MAPEWDMRPEGIVNYSYEPGEGMPYLAVRVGDLFYESEELVANNPHWFFPVFILTPS